ncbi:Glycine--tRNA ligase 2-chloroplastic/mitochondrial [Striga hermonthica]|uniref:glycine--tRNA ligase n=1 Tax=Striga hermonthica TaxID=68872 RepID=A0A9N7RTK7_STRHE|nr:Glycine--tRNA ligase 2-chloroplastic/mitochondrial [Striga hermonthica]
MTVCTCRCLFSVDNRVGTRGSTYRVIGCQNRGAGRLHVNLHLLIPTVPNAHNMAGLEEGRTEYVYVSAVEPSRLALDVLSDELPAVLGKISFPKSMRWNSEVMFSRPVRWILALHGDVVVPFTFAGVMSGNVTHGLRNTSSATIEEKLGTMLDKMTRVQSLVTKVGSKLGMTEDILKVIEEAASLVMSDLSSAVVTEFTSLAGVMGRHYALRDGYSELETCFRKTDAGTVLAISYRSESLVGLFSAGCQPSSANDPFGLRRISYGLVQLLVDTNRNLEVRYALELAAAVQPIKVESETIDDAHQFVTRRLEQLLMDKGVSPEVVRAVLAERVNLPCLAAKSAYKISDDETLLLFFNFLPMPPHVG